MQYENHSFSGLPATIVMFLLFASLAESIFADPCDFTSHKISTRMKHLLKSKEPLEHAVTHGITIRDGFVRVVIEVNERFVLDLFASKYRIKEVRKRGGIVTASVYIDSLGNLCRDPSVIFIRFPDCFSK